jgi:hypothetical protein
MGFEPIPMSKFLVFTYYAGRPLGGMSDYLDSFDSINQALDNVLPEPERYYEIVEAGSMRIVREGLSQFKDLAEPELQQRN